jgi:hypothetical protein
LLRAHGFPEEIALAGLTAPFPEEVGLRLGFNSFGHDLEFQVVG